MLATIRSAIVGILALLLCGAAAFAQALVSHPYSFLSAASNNSTLVYRDRALIQNLIVINTTGTVYYLKLYDKATAPTCGTDTPTLRIPLPINAVTTAAIEGMSFNNGVGFCLVGGLADNDNSNAATGVVINLALAWL